MESEALLRLSAFLGMLALMGALETLAPRRARTVPRLLHWANNLGMVVLNTVVVRLLFPVAATGVAAYVQGRGWGLLNLLEVPGGWPSPSPSCCSTSPSIFNTWRFTTSRGCGGCIACTMPTRTSTSPPGCASTPWKSSCPCSSSSP